ncbi:GtrA family protein [Actinomyces sp.]|uniref:GtrA family protein n=1 Tax=Actinomyces sp. TaxID=29317 RepID=UPI0026DD878F|nr:GtrA family protein [Actinomyces sp.]MDO4899344.1 GtrA family protein [Actinomyces sp.]
MEEPADTAQTLGERLLAWLRELTQFGLVGALAYVIDSGLFNLLQHGPTGVLSGHPNTANIISACVATCFSWVANRSWTYRDRTRESIAREAFLFAFANAGGILITQFCLLFTHHILGLSGTLADNISAYVVGFGLGTAFRFLFYHYVVFTGDAASRSH